MSSSRSDQTSIGSAIEERMDRIRPPSYSFDDISRRRARKQRNSRIGSAVVALALVVAVLAILRSVGGITPPGGLPASPPIDRTNAGRLSMAWTASPGSPVSASAAAKDGRIYAGFEDGTVKAFPESCAPARCRPIWSAPMITNSLSAPAISDGVVYVPVVWAGPPTGLLAYSVDCASGGATCRPLWRGVVPANVRLRNVIDADPLVTDDVVVVVTSERWVSAEELIAFPRACATATCEPRWVVPLGFSSDVSLATDGSTVFVSVGTELKAFDAACASGGHRCRPIWVDRLPAIIQLGPILVDGTIYVGAGGVVYGFPATCDRPSCGPVRSVRFEGAAGNPISSLAIIDGLVVASRLSGIEAVPFGCRSDLAAGCRSWSASTAPSPRVTTGDGLIFVAASSGVYAFDPACAPAGGSCRPLWFTPRKYPTVTVTPSAVIIGSADGRLSAFTVPGR